MRVEVQYWICCDRSAMGCPLKVAQRGSLLRSWLMLMPTGQEHPDLKLLGPNLNGASASHRDPSRTLLLWNVKRFEVYIVDACLLPAGPFSAAALVAQGAQVLKIEPGSARAGMSQEQADQLGQEVRSSGGDWELVPQPLALDLRFHQNQQVLDGILLKAHCLIHSFRRAHLNICIGLVLTKGAADRMTIRVLMLVLAMGVAIEEFAESAVENDKECSLSLLQSTMQRSDGVRRTYLKTEGDEANQVDKVNDAVTPASLLTVDAAEASQKAHAISFGDR
eukprot:g3972.t1